MLGMSEGCGDKCPRAAAPGARPGTELLLRHLPPGSPSETACAVGLSLGLTLLLWELSAQWQSKLELRPLLYILLLSEVVSGLESRIFPKFSRVLQVLSVPCAGPWGRRLVSRLGAGCHPSPESVA